MYHGEFSAQGGSALGGENLFRKIANIINADAIFNSQCELKEFIENKFINFVFTLDTMARELDVTGGFPKRSFD